MSAGVDSIAAQPPGGRSLWSDARRRLMRNRAAVVSGVILIILTLLVIIGPWLSPYAYDQTDWGMISVAPDLASGHVFGTDSLGRDLFVRTLQGGRISLLVGVVATLVSLGIGVAWGATAGYVGGRVDHVMMRIVDILYAMPFMFFVILLMVFLGRNILLIFVAIGAINWLDMARIVRGQTLSLKKMEFVEAAEAMGVGAFDIIRRHIVPNLLGVVVVYVTLTIPQVILVESFLSFLGLGVQEPMTSWGALVNEGAQEMESAPWMLIIPALFLATTLFCFNFIGDGLRDALDPKDR
jgi:oligopeptide transport system permease protein